MNLNLYSNLRKIRNKIRYVFFELKHQKEIIITGCVRSGTTLGLRVYCRGLTPAEEHHHSSVNEPRVLGEYISNGKIDLAKQCLREVLLNRYRLIKSPHIVFILPYVEPRYQLIVTFRDLRLIIPSMLSHPNVIKGVLSKKLYWEKYLNADMPSNMIDRAILLAEGFYRKIIDYKGPIKLWNYGFWDEWIVNNEKTKYLYGRGIRETSERVLREAVNGKIFSDRSFNTKVWKIFCIESKCTKQQQDAVCAANERIRQLYKKRNLIIKTLEDLD